MVDRVECRGFARVGCDRVGARGACVGDSMTDMETEIELRSIDTLIPYTNNPKEHPDEQVQKIASSIKNYGWDQPIVVDGEGEIIKGHGRMQAAELLGLDEVPVVERSDLTDAEVRAARLADNKTQMDSGLDYDLLATEIDVLEDVMPEEDLPELTGFDETEIEDLLTREGGSVDDFMGDDEYDFSDDPSPEDGDNDDGEDGESADGTGVECPECGHTFDV